jgi:hypothetical protein
MRNHRNQITPAGVMFIPDYVLTALERSGLSLEALASKYLLDDNCTQLNSIKDSIKNKISTSDIADIILFNEIYYKYLFNTNSIWEDVIRLKNTKGDDELQTGYSENPAYMYIYSMFESISNIWDIKNRNQYNNDLLNIYKNNNIEYNNILMSDNNQKLFRLEEYNNLVFVIIQDGFTNPVIYNDSDFVKQFSIRLMDYMFKRLGERPIFESRFFQMFIGLEK